MALQNPLIAQLVGNTQFDGTAGPPNKGLLDFEDLRRLPRGVGICCKYIAYRQTGAALTEVRLWWDVPTTAANSEIRLFDAPATDFANAVAGGWDFTFRGVPVPRHFEPGNANDDGQFAQLKFSTVDKDGTGTLQVYWEYRTIPDRVPGVQMTTNPRQHTTP